jgi:hypothetical protein
MQDAVHANRLHNVTRRIKPYFNGLFFHNDITIAGQIAQKKTRRELLPTGFVLKCDPL